AARYRCDNPYSGNHRAGPPRYRLPGDQRMGPAPGLAAFAAADRRRCRAFGHRTRHRAPPRRGHRHLCGGTRMSSEPGTAGTALTAALRADIERLLAAEPEVRADADDSVHQMRV